MKYIRDYRLFEKVNRNSLTDGQREFLDKYTHGKWRVSSEGLVNVVGHFRCIGEGLEDFLGIRFGKVSGHFRCCGNRLRTLEGSPREVGRNFSCRENLLKTLEGAPSKVGWRFFCDENPLISLEGAPEMIEKEFIFSIIQWRNPSIVIKYNLQSFLNNIDLMNPEESLLLLTHHFFTPQVIKEQIDKNPDFAYYVSIAWNTERFKKKQEELKKILPENILVKIEDLRSIFGGKTIVGGKKTLPIRFRRIG